MPATIYTGDISSSYDLMNLFWNYTAYTGTTANSTLTDMTRRLSKEIYRQCGNSYTSAAAKWCPPKSYILNNYRINYTNSQSAKVGVNVNISGEYEDSQLIKMADITYDGVITTTTSKKIRPKGKATIESVTYTYMISYERYYKNKNSRINDISFYAVPQFYNSSAFISEGSGTLSNGNTQNTTTYHYFNLVHPGLVTERVQVKCRDNAVSSIFATYNLDFSPLPVSSISISTGTIPTYCVLNDPNYNSDTTGWAKNIILNGRTTGTTGNGNAGVGITGKCPIPSSISAYTYSPTAPNGPREYLSNIDGVELFITTSAFNSPSSGMGTITNKASYFKQDGICTLSTLQSFLKEDGYLMWKVEAYNYDGTTIISNPYKIYYINIPETVSGIQCENITPGVRNDIYIDIWPADVYYKSINLTISSGTINNLIATEIHNENELNDSLRINFNSLINTTASSVTLTCTITKHDNTTIVKTKTVNVNYGTYDFIYLHMLENGAGTIYEDDGVDNESDAWYIIHDDSQVVPFPTAFASGSTLGKFEITYELDANNEYTDTIFVDYEWVNAQKYKLHFTLESSHGSEYSDDPSNLRLYFSNFAIVTNIKFLYGNNFSQHITFSPLVSSSVAVQLEGVDPIPGYQFAGNYWTLSIGGNMYQVYTLNNTQYCLSFEIDWSLSFNSV